MKSVYLKNNTKANIQIIYDDRTYRGQLINILYQLTNSNNLFIAKKNK